MARAARRSPTELLWDAIRFGWVQPWTARFRGGVVTVVGAVLLLAIAGRLWPDLKDAGLLSLFLEQLALQPTQFFNQVFAELVTLPALRNDMLARLRDPERSDALGQAIGRLFASA